VASAEICDGLDQNCNGQLDDGTYLPAQLDAAEWFDAGFFGMANPGVLGIWGGTAALWDATTQKVSTVMPLSQLWATGTGTPPPTSGIDALAVNPAGVLGATAPTLWVASGASLWSIDSTTKVWHQAALASVLGGLTKIDSAAIFRAGDIPGLVEPLVLIGYGGDSFIWYTASAGWSSPASTTALFCANGTTGTCPAKGVKAVSRVAGTPSASILVQSAGTTYTSPVLSNSAGLRFAWTQGSTATISCAH
jgi:hypothetical protein